MKNLTTNPTALDTALEKLVREPIVSEKHLDQLSLEELGKVLEERLATEIENAEKAQYVHLLELFTGVLFEMEGAGRNDWMNVPLSDLMGINATVATASTETPVPEPQLSTLITDASGSPSLFRDKIAFESFSSASFLMRLMETNEKEKSNLSRLATQMLAQAVESECDAIFQLAISNFWPRKDSALGWVLETSNRKLDLKSSIKKLLESWGEEHPDWILEKRFPLHTILTSLREIMTATQREKFQPSLVEFANLLLFFGHNSQVQDISFNNLLAIKGIELESITEIFFRLIRLSKLKKAALTFSSPFTESHLNQAKEDCQRLMELLGPSSYSLDQEWVATA